MTKTQFDKIDSSAEKQAQSLISSQIQLDNHYEEGMRKEKTTMKEMGGGEIFQQKIPSDFTV